MPTRAKTTEDRMIETLLKKIDAQEAYIKQQKEWITFLMNQVKTEQEHSAFYLTYIQKLIKDK